MFNYVTRFLLYGLLLFEGMYWAFLADCFWMLNALLEYTMHGNTPPVLEESRSSAAVLDRGRGAPTRREGE
jgi:hypothetical protein